MLKRKLQISDPVWWGFNRDIDLELFNSVDSLVEYFLDQCEMFLKDNNLLEQYDKFRNVKSHFHIHNGCSDENLKDYDILVNTKPNDVIYVCRHECVTEIDSYVNKR